MIAKRSTKAGAETPATHLWLGWRRDLRQTLNEGRGRDPGDTGGDQGGDPHAERRSTKAGAETPATPGWPPSKATLLRRSTKAGAETPATPTEALPNVYDCHVAQRRPGPRPRRHSF